MAHAKANDPTVQHFTSIPWCATHISDPAFDIVSTSRTPGQPDNSHTLMAETWNTRQTIPHHLTLYRAPNNNSNSTDNNNTNNDSHDSNTEQTGQVRRFYTFGSGLNAHANLLHGGVIACILDSTMGGIVGQQRPELFPFFTVKLDVTYKKAVPTPGTVLVRSWITRAEGRKVWVSGVVEGEHGVVHAQAEGMWLSAKQKGEQREEVKARI